jgi:RNA polymerase sigma-70 factor (ECF subfamily)
MALDDAALVSKLASGDRATFTHVVERFEKPLMNFISRYVVDPHAVEDLFQDTFVRVMRSIMGFVPKASFSTWLFTIARNLCLDHLRAHKRRRERALGAADPEGEANVLPFEPTLASPHDTPEQSVQKDESRNDLLRAMAKLSPAKREVLAFRYFADLSYDEISQILRTPVGTLKFRTHQALREIAQKLGHREGGSSHGLQDVL